MPPCRTRSTTSLSPGYATAEAVAFEVGYEDAGFFRRLFRRHVQLTPAQYRKRFGSLRRSVESPESFAAGGRGRVRA